MIRHLGMLLVIALLGFTIFYVSRFWDFRLWSNDGLFGVAGLRPQGGLFQHWLRGSPLAAFEILIWFVGSIFMLSAIEKAVSKARSIFLRLKPKSDLDK